MPAPRRHIHTATTPQQTTATNGAANLGRTTTSTSTTNPTTIQNAIDAPPRLGKLRPTPTNPTLGALPEKNTPHGPSVRRARWCVGGTGNLDYSTTTCPLMSPRISCSP